MPVSGNVNGLAIMHDGRTVDVDAIEQALIEAMSVRHFCDMEGQPDSGDDPYRYDSYLKRWSKALGKRIESRWPTPGVSVSVD